ncbi:MAG TPA: pyridoxal-dependent decarboxylase [Spirochaetia bacterium]|nr:pyridoxal-dependent decarboxylase [Spirochaetia bacterium]
MSFASDARIVTRQLNRFYRTSIAGEAPVIRQEPIEDIVENLELERLAREGGLGGRRLARFVQRYLATATRLHHPLYLAHQVAAPHPTGALASLIDGLTNNAMAIYEMGPAAAAIEFFVLNWMIRKIGWKPMPSPREDAGDAQHAGGALTHGGSLANLTALLAARGSLAPETWEKGTPPDLALLAPVESHYSIARAAGIMGIGSASVYELAVNEEGRIVPDRLPETFHRVESDGRRPLALVANACSTAVGLYDSLAEIAAACRERGVWLHVDGAHGASALLSEKHRSLLDGAAMADSLVWDAHKLMRTPTLCAAVLVRDARTLDGAFRQEASYLFHDKEQPGFDFIHRTVECTKAGLGLRFFAVLASLGEKGLADYVDGRIALAQEAHRYISSLPDFECAVPPESNILCFRIRGGDELQLSVRDALIQRGSPYLSTAEFNGRRYLRMVFMSPETTMRDVESAVAAARRTAGETRARD